MTKFLTYEDRLEIAASLKDNCSFGEIGKKLGKDRTTIAKEIKKHSYERKSGYSGWPYNACRHRTSCKASKLCGQDCPRKSIQYCKFCNQCNDFCPDGVRQAYLFYCDPSSPYQKGSIEVNHELIRRVLPKGTSFDDLTQQDIFLLMNHINLYKRKKLNNRNPIQAFSFFHGEELLHLLCCSEVTAENIILKPRLLKK